MPLRVIFLGNSDSAFSNRHFRALMGAGCEVTGVVDAPLALRRSTVPAGGSDISFAALARRQAIPLFEPARPNHPEFVGEIESLEPDLLLAVGYTQILKPALLSAPRRLAANFHASLLPGYRGMHPVFWCLRNAEPWSGLTVHLMDSGIDTGDILYQVRVRTRRDDNVARLYGRIMDRSLPLVGRLIADLSRERLPRRPQPEAGASYYPALQDENFRLDWRWEAAKIARWIALSPGQCFVDISPADTGPPPSAPPPPLSGTASEIVRGAAAPAAPAETPGCRLFFLDAHLSTSAPIAPAGRIQSLGRRGAIVSTGKGCLRLERVRLAGGQPLALAAACGLLGLQAGDCLANPVQRSSAVSGLRAAAVKHIS